MPDLILVLVFGDEKNEATTWCLVEEVDGEDRPIAGARTVFRADDDADVLTALTIYSAPREDEGDHIAIMYGGPTIPSPSFVMSLEDAGWEQMENDESVAALDFCLAAPPMAAVHDVILLAGKPGEDGFQIWTQTATATHPVLPMFGHRMLLDAVDALDVDPDDNEQERDDPGPDPLEAGTANTGLPCLVILAEPTEIGHARVAFWVSSLGDLDGFSLLAGGWRLTDPEEIGFDDFRFERRIELALATRTVWTEEEDGHETIELRIESPAEVDPKDYDLLPTELAQYCAAQRLLSA